MKSILRLLLIGLAVWTFVARSSRGQTLPPIKDVGIDQKLNAQLPLNLIFADETGGQVQLSTLLRGRPVVLILVQFGCPSLCTTILNDSLSTLKVIPQNAGTDYDVWTVSFDPNETATLAAAKKASYVRTYNHTRPEATAASGGWHFLTGTQENIAALTSAVGYRYKWDPATQQFIHPAALIILTPEGRVSRYFFGIDYEPTDIRLSLVEASNGKIGTITDKILLLCYHYDPSTGRYSLAIANVLRVTAALCTLILGTLIFCLWRFDRRRTRRLLTQLPTGGGGP